MSTKEHAGRFALMLCYLKQGATISQIATEMEMHYNTVRLYIQQLRRFDLAHICDWEKNQNGLKMVFKLGQGEDAPRPESRKQRRLKNVKNKSN